MIRLAFLLALAYWSNLCSAFILIQRADMGLDTLPLNENQIYTWPEFSKLLSIYSCVLADLEFLNASVEELLQLPEEVFYRLRPHQLCDVSIILNGNNNENATQGELSIIVDKLRSADNAFGNSKSHFELVAGSQHKICPVEVEVENDNDREEAKNVIRHMLQVKFPTKAPRSSGIEPMRVDGKCAKVTIGFEKSDKTSVGPKIDCHSSPSFTPSASDSPSFTVLNKNNIAKASKTKEPPQLSFFPYSFPGSTGTEKEKDVSQASSQTTSKMEEVDHVFPEHLMSIEDGNPWWLN